MSVIATSVLVYWDLKHPENLVVIGSMVNMGAGSEVSAMSIASLLNGREGDASSSEIGADANDIGAAGLRKTEVVSVCLRGSLDYKKVSRWVSCIRCWRA